ncbi:MAG: hypothetical protein BCS36_08345 [Desulfovibrio sp. MES5]|uniref:glucokinase n=1 Tax=Desulfovibrio sp. MES5 TaxID=1899016 RepID=UPI000B9CA47B|nr:glucokinase [Desulfovibrio sp. MES5]OXS28783.1 MAG: hypothetical protein BCS36_08345 [Desulfovibrio sp. MES5]
MQRILVADVGGTNCRFASFSLENDRLSLEVTAVIGSKTLTNGQSLFAALEETLSQPVESADAVVVGLAGPVDRQQGRLTNGRLHVNIADVPACPSGRCLLLNDFTLQAYATLTPPGIAALHVAGPAKERGAAVESSSKATVGNGADARARTEPRSIVGAGTGLGAASLLPIGTGEWLPVPSEAGHVAFAFLEEEEQEFRRFLCRELGQPFVSAENVLCGDGLSILHCYLTGQLLQPRQVGERALSRDTPTLRWYARFLGRFCRGWMLSTLCRGGLWIAGGVAAANPLCVTSPTFRESLYASSDATLALLQHIPVYLVTDTDSGLWGAAFAGQTLLQKYGHTHSSVPL